MRAYLALTFAVGFVLNLMVSPGLANALSLRWFGHAFFLVTSSDGVRVAMDPFGDIGYSVPEVAADVVTVSHEHGDHNAADRLAGSPVVLRGLQPGGADWNSISYELEDVRITALPAYHDNVEGRDLGLNSIFIVQTGGLRLAHLSDIGHTLSEATLQAMGPIDILLVPVGGRFSIDGSQAREVMASLRPRISVPIHCRTAVTADWPIEDENAFLTGLSHPRASGLSDALGRAGGLNRHSQKASRPAATVAVPAAQRQLRVPDETVLRSCSQRRTPEISSGQVVADRSD